MKITLFTLGALLFVCVLHAQQLNMMNGNKKVCWGQFFDSGGPNAFYSSEENLILTFEADTAGAHFVLRFVEFDLAEGDVLDIYDGNSVKSKKIGSYSKYNKIPFEIISSGKFLTFQFFSDSKLNGSGWRANVTCYIGNEKVLKESAQPKATRLLYEIDGLQEKNDIQIIEEHLSGHDFVRWVKYNGETGVLTVGVEDKSYNDLVMELILSSQESLGYEIRVKFHSVILEKK
ncbi:MAG: CUB domain-containing protein [Bacteroidales bacterium]